MQFISDYIHQKGLKFGLYANAGVKTCAGMVGSLGFEKQDLDQFIGGFQLLYLIITELKSHMTY